MDQNTKVLIWMPCGSWFVPSLMVQSLLQLRKPCQCAFLVVDRQRTDKCRNFFVQECLKNGFDYLLMVDDDNPIPPDTLEKLLEHDKDIVIAPILTRNPDNTGHHNLCAYYAEDVEVAPGEFLTNYKFITEFKDAGILHKIDAGGTWCMLIKRAVLESIAESHEYPFEYGNVIVAGQRRTTSEDVEFTERCRLKGFEIWLDERVTPVHLGNQKQILWQIGR